METAMRSFATHSLAFLVTVTMPTLPAAAGQPRFVPLDAPVATGVSADGSIVVGFGIENGNAGTEAFRWSEDLGYVPLGELAGGSFASTAWAVSGDGLTVVGNSESTNGTEAFRWTQSAGMEGLGDLPGGGVPGDIPDFGSRAVGVSSDGLVVVGSGLSESSGPQAEAFRWTSASGMVGLGDLPGGIFNSFATGASSDGSIVLGHSSTDAGHELFRWTEAEGMVGLGAYGWSFGASADGSTIFGSENSRAFRWSEASGFIDLGPLTQVALSASADGSVIVGNGDTAAFIWFAHKGALPLETVLTGVGLDVSGWQLTEARGVSADGRTVVGFGLNPQGEQQAWLAVIPEPSTIVLLTCGLAALSARQRAATLRSS